MLKLGIATEDASDLRPSFFDINTLEFSLSLLDYLFFFRFKNLNGSAVSVIISY